MPVFRTALERRRALLSVVVAAPLLALAYWNGGYSVVFRDSAAIGVWWVVLLAVAFGRWPGSGVSRPAVIVLAALASFATWTLISTAWAPNAEVAVGEFDRVVLYQGVLVIVLFGSRRTGVRPWLTGIALALAGVASIALASRFFPTLFGERGLSTFLPDSVGRLSFPVGYWNGLAILLALAVPLLLHLATESESKARGVALIPFPAIAAAVYLASSRGGAGAALVGGALYVLLAPRAWRAFVAALIVGAGCALEIVVLGHYSALADGARTAEAASQGHRAAAVTIGLGLVTAGVWSLLSRVRVRAPGPRFTRASLVLGVVVAVAAVALSHPGARWASFKQSPDAVSFDRQGFAGTHLFSGAGSGRWQFWTEAVHEWQHHRLLGGGAGSFEPWWAQHAPISYYVRDAHSLYLQALAELGPLGLLLILLVIGGALVSGARSALSERDADAAAATAGLAAFAAGAALDWIWQLTVVGVVGIALAGLAIAPGRLRPGAVTAPPPQRRFAAGVAIVAVAWALICAVAIPLFGQVKVSDSEAAARSGDTGAALVAARTARSVEPWSPSPYLQLALVYELRGEWPQAEQSIEQAIDRDTTNWRLWLIRARIETEAGHVAAARRALHRAAALNPRSPIFEDLRR